jgi:hypothetical protein
MKRGAVLVASGGQELKRHYDKSNCCQIPDLDGFTTRQAFWLAGLYPLLFNIFSLFLMPLFSFFADLINFFWIKRALLGLFEIAANLMQLRI